MDFKSKIQKLTAQEIAELQVEKALRILAENSNLITDIEAELFDAIGEKGKWTIKVDQLKSLKNAIIEQDRALKTVCQNG
jgi:hypothetical protein